MRPVGTYSIVARDEQSVGVAVQSHWYNVGAVVPWVDAACGAVAVQSFSGPEPGYRALEGLRAGDRAGADPAGAAGGRRPAGRRADRDHGCQRDVRDAHRRGMHPVRRPSRRCGLLGAGEPDGHRRRVGGDGHGVRARRRRSRRAPARRARGGRSGRRRRARPSIGGDRGGVPGTAGAPRPRLRPARRGPPGPRAGAPPSRPPAARLHPAQRRRPAPGAPGRRRSARLPTKRRFGPPATAPPMANRSSGPGSRWRAATGSTTPSSTSGGQEH